MFGGFWLRKVIRVEVYHVREANPMLAFFSLLGAIIVAELVKFATQIVLYSRDA